MSLDLLKPETFWAMSSLLGRHLFQIPGYQITKSMTLQNVCIWKEPLYIQLRFNHPAPTLGIGLLDERLAQGRLVGSSNLNLPFAISSSNTGHVNSPAVT